MVKIQVQLPDHLLQETKRIAEQYEMSLAGVVRRALELTIPGYPPLASSQSAWRLPTVRTKLKCDPFENPDWREQANLPEP